MAAGRAAPAAIPHSRRIRRCDAQDIADELIAECQRYWLRCALFVFPDGEYRITLVGSALFCRVMTESPRALCGVYTADACRCDLVADIRARCEMIGIEWFDA